MSVAIHGERNDALIDWYRSHSRSLHWRSSSDPYAILVAEVMSQQTQAERVASHYDAFLSAFPSVHVLARARFADVAAAWSGLGYNSRAKRLHLAAKHISADGWPTTYEALLGLPGVGPYTAAAVACFAFGEQRPAVDTNLRRVLSRWFGEVLNGATLQRSAHEAIGTDAAEWNQAMMDLGATLCRPHTPRCSGCPVARWCTGPDVYRPPRPQRPFEGSLRQARGAVMRAIIGGSAELRGVALATGLPRETLQEAIEALAGDGLVEVQADGHLELTE